MTDSPTDDSAYIKGLGVDSQWQGNRGRMFSTDSSHSESEELPQYKAAAASTLVEHVSLLDVFSQPNVVRNTGIICTIGEQGSGKGKNAQGLFCVCFRGCISCFPCGRWQ